MNCSVSCGLFSSSFQVVERVTIFVMDANDEKPDFKNMPAIIDVLEVSCVLCLNQVPVSPQKIDKVIQYTLLLKKLCFLFLVGIVLFWIFYDFFQDLYCSLT